MIRNMRNRLRRKTDKHLRRDDLRRALRTESLEQRQFLAADSVPSLVNFATTEHTDLNISSQWSLGPLVETDPPTQFANDEVVLYVGEPAKSPRSADEKFDFIGPDTVEELYLLPQSQNVEVLYAGFASYGLGSSVDRYDPVDESKGRVSGVARYAKATLTEVRHTTPDGEAGDGYFSLWQSGSLGTPVVAMASWDDGVDNPNTDGLDVTDGISADDAMWIYAGGHAHYNFGFTEPGRYEVDMKLSAYFGDDNLSTPNESGFSESLPTTLYFSVVSVGELQFDQSSYTVNESEGNASIDVVRVGGSDGRITANYATSDTSASEPSDYTATSGELEFLDGETLKTITIPIIDDTLEEGEESFKVELSGSGPSTIDGYLKVIEENENGLLGSITTTTVTIPANDTPPTISDIADQSIDENASTGALAFTVGDAETAPADLIVTATSSNPTLVPNGNIVLGGSGANRTVTVTPVAELHGVTTITLTVEDEDGLTATDTFELTVGAVNDLPTISDVANQTIGHSTSTGALAFTVGDIETSAAALTVTGTSSNTTLVPNGNIVIGGSGANRTVTVTPAVDQFGSATITLMVTDADGGSSSDTFVLTVNAPVNAPTISSISDLWINENSSTGSIAFTVDDGETAAGDLVVAATSSNTTVVPDANLVLGGSESNRTLTITPAADQVGTTTITVTVTDEGGLQASETFDLLVTGEHVVPFALPEVVMPEPGYAYNTIGADLNGDGLPDALVNGFADVTYLTEVVWAPNLGDGTFGERQTILPGTSEFISQIFTVDADKDGDLDVVVVGENALQYHPNDGNGNFGSAIAIAGANGHRDAFGSDLDGDGDVDFASVSDEGIVRLFRNDSGTYVAVEIATGLDGGNAITALDADNDGDIDLMVGSNDVKQITLLVNDGSGSFSSSVLADSDIDVRNLYPGDLDGDGWIDIVSAAYFDGELAYFRNQGDNTFEKRVVDVNDSGVFGGDVGDIDGDGDMDIIAAGFDDTSVSWYANDGTGLFGDRQIIAIDGSAKYSLYDAGLADFNADGQMDVITGDTVNPFAIVVHENQFGSFTNQVIAPADGIYLQDAAVDLRVHFGVPVDVTGTPEVELQIGDQTVTAEYLSGTGTPTLTFRYVVQGDDADLDGIALASMMVAVPTGAAMTDPLGDDVDLTLPAVDLSGVVINGSAPRVASITRLDPAEPAANSVRFAITFNEPVTGVTTDTFAANFTDGLTGAAVTGVSGDGAEYVVSVDTGSGSGALGLTSGTDGIVDLEGNPLTLPILGGEVYTLQRRPERTISNYFEGGHADVTINYGDNRWNIQAPDYDLEVSEVLIVGGPDSQVAAPSGAEFDFLGAAAGSDIYVLPENSAPATVPDLGISNIPSPRDAFATFANTDPRVDSTEAWLQLQMVGMRGPEGGEFSLYNSGVAEPTVWMATSDGIDESDSLFTPAGAHGHYNWAFTQPGVYELDVFASGFLDANSNGTFDEGIDRYSESGITTIYFQINESGGPTPYTIAADLEPAEHLVPFGVPEVVGSGLDYVFEPELADINGDGHVDILTASYAADKVVWFENLGDGTYGPEQVVSAEAGYPWEAHLADLDADGDQDVIVGGYFGDLVWHENLGESFGPAQTIGEELYGPFIRSADVDGDGKLDVLVARDFGGDIYWYRNEGDGVFGSANVIATGLSEATGFVVRDLNGDGLPEAITGEYGASQLAYFVNNGDGTFGTKQTVASTSGSSVFAADDLNGDGMDDLLVVGLDSLEIGFHAGQSDGTIGAFTALPSVSKPAAATSADFDQDGDFDVLIGSYGGAVYWLQNYSGGSFSDSIEITRDVGQVNGIATADIDSDGDPDVVAADLIRGEIVVLPNRLGEFATTIRPPATRIYPAGQNLDLSIHFGYPVEVTGTPSVPLQVGDETVEATYVSGGGTTELLFRYMVVETDADDDGIELVSTSIDLNGGSLIGPTGDPVDLTLPTVDLSGVLVNGSAPVVHSVERSSDNPTAAHDVTFQVTFSESVSGVDVADFGVTLNGVTDASVTGVSGSGDEYFVTVSTGTGSGTIGLEVLETATITDTEANVIGEGFVGGEVFTLNRRPAREITNFFTQGHGDIGVGYSDGQWDLHAYVDDLYTEFAPDEVLIVGGPDSKVTAPSDTAYDFLGAEAGSEIYVLPQSNVPATIPDLGIGAGGINSDSMASYFNDDPRVDSTGSWVELQVVDVRSPEGGQFSLYSSGATEPNVWVASSDGIDDQDTVFAFANSHGHYNWAFTKPGIYEIDLFASGFADQNGNGTYDEGVDRYTESGIVTYYFSIDPPEGPQPYQIAAAPVPTGLVPFELPVNYPGFIAERSTTLVSGDFDGDGIVDLVSGGSGSLALLRGNGDATFQAETAVYEGNPLSTTTLFATDYDGDGDLDLLAGESDVFTVIGTQSNGRIVAYLNDGSGNFTAETFAEDLTIANVRFQLGDLDGDDRADLLMMADATTLVYQPALPDGGFGDPLEVSAGFTGLSLTRLDDIDADGDLDVLAYESSSRVLSMFVNDGAGSFSAGQQLTFTTTTTVRGVADVNGDGRPDILTSQSSKVVFYPQNIDGTFGELTDTGIETGSSNVWIADLNQDGFADLVYNRFPNLRWAAGRGDGTFGPAVTLERMFPNTVIAQDLDGDGDQDVVAGTSVSGQPVTVFENLAGENPMRFTPPASRTYLEGDEIEMEVFFGFPIEVTGTPRIPLQLGDSVVYADYVGGSGTSVLLFRYTVTDTDLDLDGVQFVNNTIDLNGGTMVDPEGETAVLEFPGALSGVVVNPNGPLVQMISRLDDTPTVSGSVRFQVQFAEPVTGVDATDFAARMVEGDLVDASIVSVTGADDLYEVTVSSGTGSGTLGLTVLGNGSIVDLDGDVFTNEYAVGEVYTVRQQPIDPNGTYYVEGHADYRPVFENGEFSVNLHGEIVLPSDEVITYLDSTAIVNRAEDAEFDFLGVEANEPLYLSNSSGSVGTVPFVGFGGQAMEGDVFADYKPDDDRITSSSNREYMKIQVVDMRSSSDGDFSVYQITGGELQLWITTSDGIGETDNIWEAAGSHSHYNVAFSKPGTYEVDVVVSSYVDQNNNDAYDPIIDRYVESGVKTLVFHIDTLGAVNDSFTVFEGEPLTGDVSANDDWHESMGDYVATVETEPANGTLELNSDGTFTYQPNVGFSGTDSFTYRATNQRGGYTTASVTLFAPAIEVQLVPVALPTDSSATELPTSIASVPVGDHYFVEAWVQVQNGQFNGLAGGQIDIQYTTDLLDALNLNHENFNELQSGEILDATGLIDDFGGGTLTQNQALSPDWARLGYVEVIATGPGEAEYRLLPGDLPFARFEGGNVEFDDVNLTDIATVTHTESWNLDVSVVREPSDTLDDGSVDQIPDSVSYVHEWEPFYVEVYLSNVTAVAGADTIVFDLNYDPSLTTAQQFKPGPAFEFPNGLPLLDDTTGTVSNIELIATELGLGTQPVLLGHMLFSPTGSDDAAMGEEGSRVLSAYDLGLSISAAANPAGQQVEVVTGEMPTTGMWPVPYDVDDSDQIDFADFAAFASVFGVSAENPETSFANWADFDGSGLIDFDDLAFFDANQGLTVDDHEWLSFSSVYPTPELALPQVITPPELTQTMLQSFSSFGPFNNGKDAHDVNNNGETSALDALLIINALNSPDDAQPYFLDVNGDGQTTALDALRVINRLNWIPTEQASATDEVLSTSNASAEPLWSSDSEDDEDDELIDLLAADQQLF